MSTAAIDHDALHAELFATTSLPGFVQIGTALRIVRDHRLYLPGRPAADVELLKTCEALIRQAKALPRPKVEGVGRSDSRPQCVYVHEAADGTVLYVGISLDGLARTSAHRDGSGWWPQIANIRIEHHPDRAAALDREAELIRTLKPIHNRAGVV